MLKNFSVDTITTIPLDPEALTFAARLQYVLLDWRTTKRPPGLYQGLYQYVTVCCAPIEKQSKQPAEEDEPNSLFGSLIMDVVETNTADVSVNDDGIPEQVNEYRIDELLGEGSFAKVYKCKKFDAKGVPQTYVRWFIVVSYDIRLILLNLGIESI